MSSFPRDPALEAAIVAHPDEDTPRLVYADWLDEHGDHTRAEFVRVQCHLANGSPADREWVEWGERENELVGPMRRPELTTLPGPFHFPRVWTPYPCDDTTQDFHRGFPFFCSVPRSHWGAHDVAEFADGLAELVATTAVRGLNFHTFPNRFTELLAAPAFGAVRGLTFGDLWTVPPADRERVWRAFAESPVAERLVQFRTSAGLSPEVMRALSWAGALCNVRRLAVPNLHGSPDEAHEWITGEWAQRLRHATVTAVVSPNAPSVLAGLGELPELHSLVLHNAGETEVTHTLAAGRFPKLAALSVTGLIIDGFRTLLSAKWFEQVRVLRVRTLGDQALTALAKHPVARKLRGLWFRDRVGKNGLRVFTRPGAFPELSTLDLGECEATADAAEVRNFAASVALPHLKRLTLDGWPLGDAGARALASNAALAGLTHLSLERCGITAAGQKALHESPHLRARLDFGTN